MILELRKPLTESQTKCLDEISKFVDDHGYYPTLHQLGEIMGIAHSTVFHLKRILRDKKYLNKHGEIIK